jgi:hypothetical protein
MAQQTAWSSRPRILATLGGLLFSTLAPPAQGQEPGSAKAARDSLAARVERAEEAIELLKQQLAAQSETGVTTRSGLKLEWSGRVLVSVFGNSRRTNNSDVPSTVRQDTANGLPQGGGGMSIRQSTLGLAVTSPSVWGAEFRGDVDVDFYGGQQPSAGGRTFPLLRLRTTRAILTWAHGELLVGQDVPLVSGLNPVSLAAVGVPGFAAAGNLWFWLPQARATFESRTKVRLAVQGALLAPMSGDPAGAFNTDFDVAERSKRPFVQGRLRLRWGQGEQPAELGLGVHRGWFAAKGDSLLVGRGLTADALIPIGARIDLRGEVFDGRGLRPLGGGQIGQLFGKNGAVVRGRGGWGQVNWHVNPRVSVGSGYGFDDPDDADLGTGATLKNTTVASYLIVRPAGPIVVSTEWRRTTTTFALRAYRNDHLNLGLGFEF